MLTKVKPLPVPGPLSLSHKAGRGRAIDRLTQISKPHSMFLLVCIIRVDTKLASASALVVLLDRREAATCSHPVIPFIKRSGPRGVAHNNSSKRHVLDSGAPEARKPNTKKREREKGFRPSRILRCLGAFLSIPERETVLTVMQGLWRREVRTPAKLFPNVFMICQSLRWNEKVYLHALYRVFASFDGDVEKVRPTDRRRTLVIVSRSNDSTLNTPSPTSLFHATLALSRLLFVT